MLSRFWTEDERNSLRDHYVPCLKEQIRELLPDRTWNAIVLEAGKLGLKKRQNINRKSDGSKKCVDCGAVLTEENTTPYVWKYFQYVCKECRRAREQEYRSQNKAHINELKRARKYTRKHTVKSASGKAWYGINKRDYSEACELCNKHAKKLHYHHWNDETPNLGLWICPPCHHFVHRLEMGVTPEMYYDFKEKIEKENEMK